ncbi:DUF5719 family protein [Egicoccus sp. AB-alg2]|uniref:DUF5719 family protein n=1 Tax=Egicoccus sp. AB-alg2 TaxID=3242693 RepID=UPI00359D9E1A
MRRRRTWIAAALAVVTAAGVLAADRLPDLPEASPAVAAPAAEAAVSGAWTCPVGDGREGSELAITAARPGDVGAGPGLLELDVLEQGEARPSASPPVFPGAHVRTRVQGDADLATFARWSEGPVAVSREWRLEEIDDVPEATVAGPCQHALSDRWVLPGMSTEGGHEARIRAANPFATDATVAVGFVTPEGPQEPLALQNLTVPAHGTLELTVNEALPEQPDLTAVVRVLSGRALVEGYQLARSEIGDVDGASLLSPSTAPAESWTVPWVSEAEGDTSWLWVVNLGDRPAPVELTLHTPDGGVPPEGLSELTVAPGQVRRVDLRGTLPEGVTAAAVTARSDGAPIHVAGAVLRGDDDTERTGFAVQLGIPSTDDAWLVSGGASAGRTERLDVVNPGSEPARFSVTLFNGATILRPDELADLEVGPGQSLPVLLNEALGEVDGWSAQVVASEGELVVGRVAATRSGVLSLVAHAGIPSAAWSPAGTSLVVQPEPGVVQRLGTARGIQAPDPLGRVDEEPVDEGPLDEADAEDPVTEADAEVEGDADADADAEGDADADRDANG